MKRLIKLQGRGREMQEGPGRLEEKLAYGATTAEEIRGSEKRFTCSQKVSSSDVL